MNKRTKTILIGLLSFFVLAMVLGVYFFPDEEPTDIDQGKVIAEKTPLQQSKQKADAVLAKMPAMTTAPAHNAGTAPQTDAGKSDVNPYVAYPDKTLLELAGIDMDQLLKERDASKNTIVHVEWMDHVNEILKDLDPEKKAAIIKNHTTLLYIKDKLDEAYLTGKIDHETFIKAVADLMKWHQRTYDPMLTGAEYEALFEITPEEVDDTVDELFAAAPEYGFIFNQETTVEAVKQQVQPYKLEEVDAHFKKMIFDRGNIGKQIGSGELTLEQAREALSKSEQAFFAKCKEILTENEINTIFGSLEARGAITERPNVLGDEDIDELGFQIENPATSVDNVREKIDKDKIEDIRFFYQERDAERVELINRLDTGEITSEKVENISNELDAAFEENCRSILTNDEYQLIFSVSGNVQTDASPDQEALKELTEQEVTPEKTTEEKKAEE